MRGQARARAEGALLVRAARALLLGAPAGARRVRPAGGHTGRQPQRVQRGAAGRAAVPRGAPAACAAAGGQVERVQALAQPAPWARARVLRACAARCVPQREGTQSTYSSARCSSLRAAPKGTLATTSCCHAGAQEGCRYSPEESSCAC